MSMMKVARRWFFACLLFPLPGHADGLLAVDNPASNGQVHGPYALIEAFEGNDQVAVRQYTGRWRGAYAPRAGANIGMLYVRSEAGVQANGYRLGALYRAEALAEANRDTSDLVHQNKTRIGYDPARAYPVEYRVRGFEATGARLSKSFPGQTSGAWQVDWGLGLSYLRGKRVRLETISGHVLALNAKDFNADVDLNDSNSRMKVANLGAFNAPYGVLLAPSGQGYAVDVGMVLRHPESGLGVDVGISDLFGRISWKNLPNNVTRYNTATKYYDADGFVHFNPTATRTSSYRNLSQNLDPKLRAALSYPIGTMEARGAANYTRGRWFAEAGMSYRINLKWSLSADYDFHFGTLGLMLRHDWLYLGLRTDHPDLSRAKAYGLSGGVLIPL